MARRSLFLLPLAACGCAAFARPALADDPVPAASLAAEHKVVEGDDFYRRRYEPALLPIVAGDSDIGFEFGAAATLSLFGDGIVPYRWNMDLVAAASLKGVPGGVEMAQQSYLWDIDVPALAGGRLRVNPFAEFRRTVNQGYFGLGNASMATQPPGSNNRYFQYVHEEGGARLFLRYDLHNPIYFVSVTSARYVSPTPYAGSKLVADASDRAASGGPLLLGVQPLAIGSQGAGFVYDSRDSEIFTRNGWLGQLGASFSQALPMGAGVTFGEAEISIARYLRLGGPFVLAAQGVADFKFGGVPFFELFTGGVFKPDYMIGGSASVRGVPFGRYLGPIKGVANLEIRVLHLRVHAFGQTFQFGNNAFFDTGRVWSDYTFHSPLDGRGLGLKWGSGVGMYFLWGQAAMFRVEVAYSPDASSVDPGLPLGIYVNDGLSF